MAGDGSVTKDGPVLSLHQRILDDIETRILSGNGCLGTVFRSNTS